MRGNIAKDDARTHRHRACRELLAQHDDTRRGGADRQAAGQPRPKLGGREDREPAVHDEVVQAVHGVDVVNELPEFRHRSRRRRNRRGLVEPQRRSGGTRRAHDCGEPRDHHGVEPTGSNPLWLLEARKAHRFQ
jgi:hypothetical protein